MAYRTLEVTLISAKDLKQVNLFSKMEVYAVVSLFGDPRSRQRTPPDREGDRNPTWNSTFRFNVPADNYGRQVLHILLRAERTLGDRDVGEVRIPLSELLDAAAGNGPKFVSYQVRKCTSGEPKGVLKLLYMVGEEIAAPAPSPPVANPLPSGVPMSDETVTAYPSGCAYPPPAKVPKADEPVMAYPAPGTGSAAYPPYGAQPYPLPPKAPKAHEPVMAYPAAGTGSVAYPPYGPQPYPPPAGYPGYPPATGYPAYPPAAAGYPAFTPPPRGYAPPPHQAGYGYLPAAPPKKNEFVLHVGTPGLLGIASHLLGIGDMISDAGGFDEGYDADYGDAAGI